MKNISRNILILILCIAIISATIVTIIYLRNTQSDIETSRATIGYQHVGVNNCTFEIYWAVISNYSNVQVVLSRDINYIGPHTPDIAEVVTDSFGNQRIHLKFSNVSNGDIIVLTYTTSYKLYPEKVTSITEIPSTPILSIPEEYPAEVRKYLNPGLGIEITPLLTDYVNNITSGTTYQQVLADVFAELEANYTLDLPTTEYIVSGTANVTSFPEPDIRNATEVYLDKTCVCVEYARFLASLMRIKNIPCRTVSQFESGVTTHSWNQIYVKGTGWIDVDPTTNKYPRRTATELGIAYLLIDEDQDDTSVVTFNTTPSTLFRIMSQSEVLPLLNHPELWSSMPSGL
ncbi:MAG: transglutaminase-like domain-containing protein [Candidatus Helarchaeota archaeon]